MATTLNATELNANHTPHIQSLSADAPYRWLRRGWTDFKKSKAPSLALGSLFALSGFALTVASWSTPVLTITFLTGFLLVAPALALGFYEISKRLERGQTPGFGSLFFSWKEHGWPVLVFGLLLGLVMVAWGRLTGLIVAVSLPAIGPYSDLLSWQVMTDPAFIALYLTAGLVLAAIVFSICAVSIPMLVDRKTDVLTAAFTSLRTVRQNPGVMTRWAFIIALLTVAGMATGFIGLMIIMPILGHASWHAYKEAVAD